MRNQDCGGDLCSSSNPYGDEARLHARTGSALWWRAIQLAPHPFSPLWFCVRSTPSQQLCVAFGRDAVAHFKTSLSVVLRVDGVAYQGDAVLPLKSVPSLSPLRRGERQCATDDQRHGLPLRTSHAMAASPVLYSRAFPRSCEGFCAAG